MDPSPPSGPSRLDWISTQWSTCREPARFVLRYGPAIRKYLRALIRDPQEAEEAEQDFLLKVVQDGFARADPDRGRFRHYLKAALRNAALTHLTRKRPRGQGDFDPDALAAPVDPAGADEDWRTEWRRCILDAVWRTVERHERQAPDSRYHSTLKLVAEHADESSEQLAARLAAVSGQPIRPEAFRKQLSRARRFFAEALVTEIAEALDEPIPELVEEELIELGLMGYVRDFLPGDWRGRGRLAEPE